MLRHLRLVCRLIVISVVLATEAPAAELPPLFTREQVLEFSPRARRDLVDALVVNQQLLRDAGVVTRRRLAHFFAQVATETGGMRRIDENLNYSYKTLLRVFSRKTISDMKAREIAGKPPLIANWVYGGRLGNRGRQTNDGWDYRGSGFLQLTGRENFRRRGGELDLPLEEDPEMARRSSEGLKAAVGYWRARRLNEAADDNDIRLTRIRVNGPKAHGIEQAKMWFPKAWKAFRVVSATATEEAEGVAEEVLPGGVEVAETKAVAEALESMGFIKGGAVESGGVRTDSLAAGLRAYQQSRELKQTGVLDEDTFYSITDPEEWRHDEADTLSEPTDDPDGSVSVDLLAANDSAAVPELNSNEGTGVQENESDSQLSNNELATLSGSKESYASYEFERGSTDANDNFIPFSVVEPDDRVAVTDTTTYPARAIVQINFSPRGSASRHLCSGAMISPDMVLTAGHCVHNGTRAGEWYTDYVVLPGRNTGSKPFGRCGVTKLFALKGWVTAGSSDEARYYDLGALKLDCDVGTRTGYFGVRPLQDGATGLSTKVQGYAGDRTPAGRQWLSEDKIRVLQTLKGFYQNDTYGGTSGSPVYSGNEYSIIGVHTNGFHDGEPWRSNNAFTRITPARLREIASWVQK